MSSLDYNIYNRIGSMLIEKVKDRMRKVSKGRLYYIKGKLHRASKPYDPANILSGNLYKTIGKVVKKDKLILGLGNGIINYAKYLERGTRKMDPRPNVSTIFKDNKGSIRNVVKEEVYSYIKGMLK